MENLSIHITEAIKILLIGLGIPLVLSVCLGFLTSLLQAATQLQDQIFSFFPKVVLLALLIILGGELFLNLLVENLQQLLINIRYVN